MKKIILILFAFILNIFSVNFANAENFVINTYNVKMNISEDRTADIEEDINVFFTRSSHGIFRSIPIKNTITRNDGSKNSETAKITDIKATQLHGKSVENGKLILKLGDPNILVSGNKKYRISYKYDMGNDNINKADEFYFNIIGNEWDTSINKVYFTITLPKEFDASKVGFSLGIKNSVGYNPNDLKFNVQGNTITGYTTTSLNPREGLTIRMELPENYFIKKMDYRNYYLILALVLTAFPIGLWLIYGKDDPVTPIVNFDVPEGKNSGEIEVEYNGTSSLKGVTSLIFYLASKGYIEIVDDGISFIINKLKPYDGNKATERDMMEALFYGNKDSVTQIQLEHSSIFRIYCSKIQKSLNKISGFLFNKEACSFEKIAIMIVSVIGLIVLFLYTISDYTFSYITGELGFIILFPVIAAIVMTALIQQGKVFFALIWGLPFGVIPLIMLLVKASNLDKNYPMLLLEVVCLVVSIICLVNMPKRNQKGRIALGQILGLKKYIEVAEKPRLLAMLKEKPEYVSEILPFAYVLGVENHLLDSIEGYDDLQPRWYHGSFNSHSFNNIANTIHTAAIPPSSSSHHGGDGFSGGGYSGGGHGGGGGGSW